MNEIELPSILDGEDKSSALKNTIRNLYRHVRKWAKRQHTNCFRLYDRQLHHYPLAIDFYAGRYCVHYFAKKDAELPASLQAEVNGVLHDLFGAAESHIFWRSRIKRKMTEQYEKANQKRLFFPVVEKNVQFLVNLTDYLDTGLFLDHRETRLLAAKMAKDKRVLNLFAYTCSFSVHAAFSGALATTSVDMSNTYTKWGEENFKLNGLPLKNNRIIREDCVRFLAQEAKTSNRFDLIIIDPPTLSRSKKMTDLFDVQRDHVSLILAANKLLARGGTILFSTNSRRFKLDEEGLTNFSIQDITNKTLPLDFHDPHIHKCWLFQPKEKTCK